VVPFFPVLACFFSVLPAFFLAFPIVRAMLFLLVLARFFLLAAFFFVAFAFFLVPGAFFRVRVGPLPLFFPASTYFFLPAVVPRFAFVGFSLATFFLPVPARFHPLVTFFAPVLTGFFELPSVPFVPHAGRFARGCMVVSPRRAFDPHPECRRARVDAWGVGAEADA
jgi:hypothetical protein